MGRHTKLCGQVKFFTGGFGLQDATEDKNEFFEPTFQ
jgi:hypothetical protein